MLRGTSSKATEGKKKENISRGFFFQINKEVLGNHIKYLKLNLMTTFYRAFLFSVELCNNI